MEGLMAMEYKNKMPNAEVQPAMDMEIEISTAEQSEDEMFAQMAPTGDFSANAMNRLVDATNKLLPAFDQEPNYPSFSDKVNTFPGDFVRILAMFQGAVNMAVDYDVIDEEMDFMMEDINDDRAIMMLAGKLSKLANDRAFKSFLQNPPDVEEEAPEPMEPEEEVMGDEEMDDLFASRM